MFLYYRTYQIFNTPVYIVDLQRSGALIKHTRFSEFSYSWTFVCREVLPEYSCKARGLGKATLDPDLPCSCPIHAVLSPSQDTFQPGHKGGIPPAVLTQRLELHPRPSSSLWAQQSLEMWRHPRRTTSQLVLSEAGRWSEEERVRKGKGMNIILQSGASTAIA